MNISKIKFALSVLTCAILSGCVIEETPVSGISSALDADKSDLNSVGNAVIPLADINLFEFIEFKDESLYVNKTLEGTDKEGNRTASIASKGVVLKQFDNKNTAAKDIVHWEYSTNIATWKGKPHDAAFAPSCDEVLEGHAADDKVAQADKVGCFFLSRPEAVTTNGLPVASAMTQKGIYGLVGGVKYVVKYSAFSGAAAGEAGVEVTLRDKDGNTIKTLSFTKSVTGPGWIYPQFEFEIPASNYEEGWVSTDVSLVATNTTGLYRVVKPQLSVPAENTVKAGEIGSDLISVTVDGDQPWMTIGNDDFDSFGAKFISDANNAFKYAWIESLKLSDDGKLEYIASDTYAYELDEYYKELDNKGITGITYFDFPVDSDDVGTFSSPLVSDTGIFHKENLRWAAAAAYHFAKNHADTYPVVGALNYSLRRLEDAGLAAATNTGEEYLQLLKAVSMGIKAASPDMKVSAFSFAGDHNWAGHKNYKDANTIPEKQLIKNSITLGMDKYYDMVNQNSRPLTIPTKDAFNASYDHQYTLYAASRMNHYWKRQTTIQLRKWLETLCPVEGKQCQSDTRTLPIWLTGAGVPTQLDSKDVFNVDGIDLAKALVLNNGELADMADNFTMDGKKYHAGSETKSVYTSDTNGALQAISEVSLALGATAEKVFVRSMDGISSKEEGFGQGQNLYDIKPKTLAAINELKMLLDSVVPEVGNANAYLQFAKNITNATDAQKKDGTQVQWSRYSKDDNNYFVISVSLVNGIKDLGYLSAAIDGLEADKTATVYQFDPTTPEWTETTDADLAGITIDANTPVVVVQGK